MDSCLIQGSVVLWLHMSPHDVCAGIAVLFCSGVSIFHEQLVYLSIHGYAAGSLIVLFIIISFKFYSCVLSPFPVGCHLIVLLQDLKKM